MILIAILSCVTLQSALSEIYFPFKLPFLRIDNNLDATHQSVIFDELMDKFKGIERLEKEYINELLQQYEFISDKLQQLGNLPQQDVVAKGKDSEAFSLK